MTEKELAERIKQGNKRGQVCLGGDRLLALARRHQVGFAVATSDLSKNSLKKLRNTCQKFDVPLLLVGAAEEFGEWSGFPSTFVYALKPNTSGLRHIKQSFEDEVEAL